MAGDNDIHIRIDSYDHGLGGQAGSGPTASTGGGSQPTGSAGSRPQPTPNQFGGSSSSDSSNDFEKRSTAELRDLFGVGERASGLENVLRSMRMTRGIGDMLKSVRQNRNEESFQQYRKDYRSYERERDEYLRSMEKAKSPPVPPAFRPGGQNFVPSASPTPGGAYPPLPSGGPSTPPGTLPNGQPASGSGGGSGSVPPLPGGSGGPPTPPQVPGQSGGGFFPNLGASGGAALAGLVGTGVGIAIGGTLGVIGKGIETVVSLTRSLLTEFRETKTDVAPFSNPVLESLVQEQLQRLTDIQHRGEIAGEEIAAVNKEMTALNSELYRLVSEVLRTTGPEVVEALKSLVVLVRGVRDAQELVGEPLLKMIEAVAPSLAFLTIWLRNANDVQAEQQRVAVLADFLFRPKGVDPADTDDDVAPVGMFPTDAPRAMTFPDPRFPI